MNDLLRLIIKEEVAIGIDATFEDRLLARLKDYTTKATLNGAAYAFEKIDNAIKTVIEEWLDRGDK